MAVLQTGFESGSGFLLLGSGPKSDTKNLTPTPLQQTRAEL